MPMTYVNLANQLSSIRAAGQHSEHSRRNPDAVWVRRGPAKGLGGNNYPRKKLQRQKQSEFFRRSLISRRCRRKIRQCTNLGCSENLTVSAECSFWTIHANRAKSKLCRNLVRKRPEEKPVILTVTTRKSFLLNGYKPGCNINHQSGGLMNQQQPQRHQKKNQMPC